MIVNIFSSANKEKNQYKIWNNFCKCTCKYILNTTGDVCEWIHCCAILFISAEAFSVTSIVVSPTSLTVSLPP